LVGWLPAVWPKWSHRSFAAKKGVSPAANRLARALARSVRPLSGEKLARRWTPRSQARASHPTPPTNEYRYAAEAFGHS
jgi:hypothetical protein